MSYEPMKSYAGVLKKRGMVMPSKAQLKEANALFPAYIFFKNGKRSRKLWTSCCHKETEWNLIQRVMTENKDKISYGKHNEKAVCPYCGAEVTLKNISKIGKKRNLKRYEPVLFLNEKDGKLQAVAAWALKDYADLTAEPLYYMNYNYKFALGKAEVYFDDYFDKEYHGVLEKRYSPTKLVLTEPFKSGSSYFSSNEPYSIIGLENLEKSELGYCQYSSFHHPMMVHSDFIKYMSLYCIYPQKVEMLMKTGKREYIDDILWYRKKNADLLKWEEPDPCKAFGLTRQEFKEYFNGEVSMEELRIFKQLKKNGEKASFNQAKELLKEVGYDCIKFLKLCKKYKLKSQKAVKYIEKFTGPMCYGAIATFSSVYQLWKDYIDAAEELGYDLNNETVLLPKNLELKHNEATTELHRMLEIEAMKKKEGELKKIEKSLARRREKYNFSYDGMVIRVAENEKEILAEGKILSHCVGGYAARHMQGVLTILFLRYEESPGIPLVTVEMDGNRIVQAHGYKNDRGGEDPQVKFKKFFKVWTAWLKAGSKRDKEGNPKIKERKAA